MLSEWPRKDRRSMSFGLQSTSTVKRTSGLARTRWRGYISDLAWSHLDVDPAELSEIAVDCEAFGPTTLPKENLGTKKNEWLCRPTLKISICEIVFYLFAKSECLIQIIKHIWTELAFLRKSVQSIRHRREHGVDTLKNHHDTLSNTSKKHWCCVTLQVSCWSS